jgi:hypothetical protein
VTSATYRQRSNVRNSQAESFDADNKLLWRMNPRRLEGEAVRDAVLKVSGALNPQVGGPSFRDITIKVGMNHEFTEPTEEFSDAVNRRTVYRLWARSAGLPMLDSLDCPEPSVMSPVRTKTITPVQALSLLNSRFSENCAERFAERVRREAGEDRAKQVSGAYRLALGREPNDRESALASGFVERRGLAQFCIVLFNTNEFLYVE